MNRKCTLVMVAILLLCSLFMVKSATAQSIPNPSVPEFTAEYVEHSYDVPLTTTYSKDPYTGEMIPTTSGGYHVVNRTIDITIKNQPFSPTKLTNGNTTGLYYTVRSKGHSEEKWVDFVGPSVLHYPSSGSIYTLISFPSIYRQWSD